MMGYWVIALVLIGFGFLAAFSIGTPFIVVGVALVVLGPVRRRSALFWPAFSAVIAGNVAYWAVVPAYCTATSEVTQAGATAGATTTVCSSLLGIVYPGVDTYAPSSGPATVAAVAAAAIAFVAALVAVTIRAGTTP